MDLPDNTFLQFLIIYGYWFAVPIMIIEGPIATIVMSFFASFGYFNPFVVLTFSFFADMISDTVFYAIGRINGDGFVRRFGKYFKLSERTFLYLQDFFGKHGGKSIFLAKILFGIVPPVFITAGYSRMNLKKFYFFSSLGGILWSSSMVALGYFFGFQFAGEFGNIGELFTNAGLVMVGLLALFIVYRFYLHKIVASKFKLLLKPVGKNNNNENLQAQAATKENKTR